SRPRLIRSTVSIRSHTGPPERDIDEPALQRISRAECAAQHVAELALCSVRHLVERTCRGRWRQHVRHLLDATTRRRPGKAECGLRELAHAPTRLPGPTSTWTRW